MAKRFVWNIEILQSCTLSREFCKSTACKVVELEKKSVILRHKLK